eukprot:403368496
MRSLRKLLTNLYLISFLAVLLSSFSLLPSVQGYKIRSLLQLYNRQQPAVVHGSDTNALREQELKKSYSKPKVSGRNSDRYDEADNKHQLLPNTITQLFTTEVQPEREFSTREMSQYLQGELLL